MFSLVPKSVTSDNGKLVRGNVLWLSIVSLLTDLSSEMIYPLLPLFLVTRLGAGPAFLGLVEGIAETTASVVKYVSGAASDRFGRRKPLVAWGYGLAGSARPLIAVVTTPFQLLAVRFADRVGKGIRTAPRDALLAASVPAERRGRAFGIHRAADHTGAVLGPLVASAVLLLYPGELRLVFALAAVPAVLAFLAVVLKVRENPAAAAHSAEQPDPPPVVSARAGIRDPAFRRYLAVLLLFTLGNATDAFLLLRAQELGVAIALIPLLWAALHLSKVAWSIAGGALADRYGPRRTIIAGWGVYAAVYSGFALATAEWQVWALFLTYGIFFGLTEAPEKALVAGLVPAERRGSAFGAYHLAIGLGALPASLLFGLIWQQAGAPAAFLTGSALALAAALALPFALPGPRVASFEGDPGRRQT